MKPNYPALLLPAYGVTLIAVPIAMTLDTMGRGAEPYLFLTVPALTCLYTGMFALPFVLPAAGLAFFIQLPAVDWWQTRAGRLLFALICALLGAAILQLTIHAFTLVAAVAGGTAGWVATSHTWPLRLRLGLVLSAGLAVGLVQGIQYY